MITEPVNLEQSPVESSAGDTPLSGTDLAKWQEQMAQLQTQYAENRSAWRDKTVGPLLPPEKRKKGRPA